MDGKSAYRAKSFHSNRHSSFGRSSYKGERSDATVCRTSTDMQTNFDSLIARYQTAPKSRLMKNALPATTGSAYRSGGAGTIAGGYKQAQ